MPALAMTDPNNVAGEENLLGEPSYKYLTADEMRGLGDDSMAIDVTHDEKQKAEVAPPSISGTMVSVSHTFRFVSSASGGNFTFIRSLALTACLISE